MKRYVQAIIFSLCFGAGYAQQKEDSGYQVINLNDLSSFRQQAGNWRIVGDVTINPSVDIHEPETAAPPTEETSKKKRKSQPEPVVQAKPKAVTFAEGTGILLNMNDKEKKDHLLTTLEHGDIELELEVMLPKGSNSGIYLQGRYEVQLLDSWGVRRPSFSDIGGIYRNWENHPGKIYSGKAPLTNAAKAPGLWQKFKISFRAPRFDSQGNKIANAKFTSVELNGVKIHDNVEVPLPTGGPIENNEKATGPLMIQGDHGPVAFRNIRYKLMKEADISLSNISYKTYYGKFSTEKDYASLKPAATGEMEELTVEILENENEYAATYNADITIPEDGEYQFTIRFTGGGSVKVNGQELMSFQRADGWIDQDQKISLKAGTYPVEIQNFKDVGWMPPLLGLWVRTANTYPVALHAYNSFPPYDNPPAPILINANSEPRLLRAFIDYKGDRKQRLTHTIGVGEPSGINYVYDLKSGSLVCVWKGDFVDATPMWHDRGDGSFRPMGAPQYLTKNVAIGTLRNAQDAFPATNESEFKGKGYVIDKSGRPVFKYNYQGIEVEDKIYPEDENRMFSREIVAKTNSTSAVFYKMAEGKSIVKIADDLYAVDDKQYYIKVAPSANPVVRNTNGVSELVAPVAGSSLKYSIIW